MWLLGDVNKIQQMKNFTTKTGGPTRMKDWQALSLKRIYDSSLCGAICVSYSSIQY